MSFLKFWRLEIQDEVPADSVSGESSLGLQKPHHMVERARDPSAVSPYQSCQIRVMASFNLSYFLVGPPPNTVTLGMRASTYEFRRLTCPSTALIKHPWGLR